MAIHEEIYQRLIETARASGLIHYGDIAPLADLDLGSPGDRNRLAKILEEISTSEHRNGRPLLSAVVVLAGPEMPGEGFFTLARHLGKFHGHSPDEQVVFFAQEVKRVHAYWKDH